ncbi:MAG TPA: MM0924 family protein [Methanothrix sp.]|nr:MM0924 family protein [Methanothrix sp.]
MSEHLYGKNIEVYFGGDEKERMKGKLVGSADGVIVLEYNDRRDYINVEKVVAAWEV